MHVIIMLKVGETYIKLKVGETYIKLKMGETYIELNTQNNGRLLFNVR